VNDEDALREFAHHCGKLSDAVRDFARTAGIAARADDAGERAIQEFTDFGWAAENLKLTVAMFQAAPAHPSPEVATLVSQALSKYADAAGAGWEAAAARDAAAIEAGTATKDADDLVWQAVEADREWRAHR
jgi:hypothetical protein